MSEVSIIREQVEGRPTFTFEAEGGILTAGYRPTTGVFATGSLHVPLEQRRRGIAKSLLRSALAEARALGANSFGSLITSRECLDAERAVFGDEAIRVIREGTYTPEGEPERRDTCAVLQLELNHIRQA